MPDPSGIDDEGLGLDRGYQKQKDEGNYEFHLYWFMPLMAIKPMALMAFFIAII